MERVQQLSGLKPVDGVYKLEGAIQEIDEYLTTISPTSSAYSEAIRLKQTYTNYLNEAKELRQKGMASFRKYLAMKNNNPSKKDNENSNDNNNDDHNNKIHAHNTSNTSNTSSINNVNNQITNVNVNMNMNRNINSNPTNNTNNTEMMQLKEEVCNK